MKHSRAISPPMQFLRKPKRPRIQADPEVIVIDDDEEDMTAIMSRIKEQEASEALARRLQGDWNGNGGESSRRDAVISIDDSEGEDLDDRPNVSSPSYESDTPPEQSLLPFRDFFTGDRPCPKCSKPMKSPRGYVTFSATSPPPSLMVLLHVTCAPCRKAYCRGCLTALPCPPSCTGAPLKSKSSPCPVLTCCAEIRAIALFEVLGGFDRQYIEERETSKSRALATLTKRGKNVKKGKGKTSVGPGGTGYGLDDYDTWNGTGYGHGGANRATGLPKSTQRLAEHWEDLLFRSLTLLTDLLPSPYSDNPSTYDLLSHPSLGSLLAFSQIPDLLATLLRNDSVTDWISRSEVYYTMLGLLRRMADCELCVPVLTCQRWERKADSKSCGIEEWMWGESEIHWEEKKPILVPLYEYFKKLTKQCETFLKGVQRMDGGSGQDEGDEYDEMEMKATGLCGDIIAAKDDIERIMGVLGYPTSGNGNGKGKGRLQECSSATSADMEKAYERSHEQLSFAHVCLAPYTFYNYNAQLGQTSQSTRKPGDRLHLIKELSVIATCLPVGVWVRVDEVRNDAVKVLISGPPSTPYAYGLFEFDVFMPLAYPNTPPLFHLRTTGGGRVGFNPNLYPCGKVCLSLLGTWAGRPEEQWSAKSTLLQVLVSIQSMIFIDYPYFNEPGHGQSNPSNSGSIQYNKNVTAQCVRWGMVEWLKDDIKDGVWGDVVKAHFTLKKNEIMNQVRQWAIKEPSIKAYAANSVDMVSAGDWGRRGSGNGVGPKMDLMKELENGIKRVERW